MTTPKPDQTHNGEIGQSREIWWTGGPLEVSALRHFIRDLPDDAELTVGTSVNNSEQSITANWQQPRRKK